MSSRVPTENGEALVEVRLANVERIFDTRDPAPFRGRALDPGFIEYLVEAARDCAAVGRIRIVIRLAEPSAPGQVEQAVRGHFQGALERSQRRRREQVRIGWIALAVAALGVILLNGLGEVVAGQVAGTLGSGLREAIVISGWVLMWRPIDVLLYDGIPWRRERRVLRALHQARIDVRAGDGGRE
jgi:hypothetical protein